MTPTTSTFGGNVVSPKLKRINSGGASKGLLESGKEAVEGKETWSKAKWASEATS